MTDVRTRLADALRKAMFCDPEWAFVGNPEQLADAILSLPGIAIVELPEAEKLDHGMTNYGVAKAMTADRFPGQVGRPGSLHWISPQEARLQAAALLAAANAAEAAQ